MAGPDGCSAAAKHGRLRVKRTPVHGYNSNRYPHALSKTTVLRTNAELRQWDQPYNAPGPTKYATAPSNSDAPARLTTGALLRHYAEPVTGAFSLILPCLDSGSNPRA